MAILARNHVQHDDPLRDEYIQTPFLYSGPQLSPTRDPKKAQKMLGLVTDFSRPRSVAVELPPLRDASKAKRTLGLVTDLPRDRRSWRASVSGGETYQGGMQEMLAKAEHDLRISLGQDDDWGIKTGGSSQRDTLSATRGWIDIALAHEPELLESPSRSLSPLPSAQQQSLSPLSTVSPIDLDAELASLRDLPPPPRVRSPRPRPLSCASSSLPMHARRHNKIASSRSRGLRANSYPNFSRPIAPKPVPGEEMERDPLHLRYQNEPPTPASPVANDGQDPFDGIIAARTQIEEQLKKTHTGEQQKAPRRGHKKARWSSLPISLLQFAKKRSSKTEEENLGGKKFDGKKKEKIDLTEDNLQRWEDEVGYVPKMYRLGYDILRSPVEMDMEVERATSTPTPSFARRNPASLSLPKLSNLSLLTPPSSPPMTHSAFASSSSSKPRASPVPFATSSTSKPRASPIPRPLPLSLPTPPLDGQNEPTLAAQKEYLASLVICTICKEAEHPSTFPARKITSKCKHKTQTCRECIQQWVETCVETRGWDRCTCPECGEKLGYEDARAFLSGPAFERYDARAAHAALDEIKDFHWCLAPGCSSGQIQGSSSLSAVFRCAACGHAYCLKHPTIPYSSHRDITCAQLDAQLGASPLSAHVLAEKAGQRTVQETSKRCPNALCGWWIEKNEGCDHMRCFKCGFEFCWECGAAFGRVDKRGSWAHRRGCRYWV